MMDPRRIKLWVCVWCMAAPLVSNAPAAGARGELYLDIIDMAAISRMSPQQLEKLAEGLAAEEIMRTKRSSAHSVSSVVSKASSGLQSKIGLLGQASAFISSASSKSGDEHHGYSYEPAHHDEKYDYWGLKKSILYTLFQAVKAITGGVTILKGQLIKGGGHLASTLGKVIAGKGDVVSNFGKKIVSSAALSEKKPHSHSSVVYGPPPTAHAEYGPPASYGAPTAPAHYHTGPALPTGYAAHKYPSTLDGRGTLSGVHAGLVLLAPVGEVPHAAHTPLDPPPSVLTTVFSAIKNAFSTVAAPAPYAPSAPSAPGHVEEPYLHQPPPPPQPLPEFKPMGWDSPALDSYGEPAAADAYAGYDPRNPHPPFDYAAAKHSAPSTYNTGLTPEKIQKINFNLAKLNHYMNQQARSSEEAPKFAGLDAYRRLLESGPQLPTPVVSDNEIGVLPAALLPDLDSLSSSTTTTTTTTTTITPAPPTTPELPSTTVAETRRKDYKYFLRGNKIILV